MRTFRQQVARRACLTFLTLQGLLWSSSAAGPLLTTKGNQVVDELGNKVVFKGIGWYGFDTGLTAPGNLSQGIDSVSKDFKTIVWRIQQLGFNSVRLPFSFAHFKDKPIDYMKLCGVPSVLDIKKTLVPSSYPSLPLSGAAEPQQDPPQVTLVPPSYTQALCNSEMPNTSTRDRYIWVVQYLVQQGLYVNLDFHTIMVGNAWAADPTFFNMTHWVDEWVSLVADILTVAPAAKGRLLLDLVNEPDGYQLQWEATPQTYALSDYYFAVMDKMYVICPDCLLLVEGTGQTKYRTNWGNGYATDKATVQQYNISDATSFFTKLLKKPYLQQVVLAPHVYCPAVSGAKDMYAGPDLYKKLSNTFGYLTQTGFCPDLLKNTTADCHVFPVILDEFGSTLANNAEKACFQSIVSYANNIGEAKDRQHADIESWFYWAWNPDSGGTGGIVDTVNWRTIHWDKIDSLTGGTKDFPVGLGLKPWYLAGSSTPKLQGAVIVAPVANSPSDAPAATAMATSPIALAPGADIFTAGGPLAGGAGQDDTPHQTMKTSWVIVIAVAVTALTVAILVFGLWMCGFIRPSIDHTAEHARSTMEGKGGLVMVVDSRKATKTASPSSGLPKIKLIATPSGIRPAPEVHGLDIVLPSTPETSAANFPHDHL